MGRWLNTNVEPIYISSRTTAHLCSGREKGVVNNTQFLAALFVLFQPLNSQHNVGTLSLQELIMKLKSNGGGGVTVSSFILFTNPVFTPRRVLRETSSITHASVLSVSHAWVSRQPDPLKAGTSCCVNAAAFQSLDLFTFSH